MRFFSQNRIVSLLEKVIWNSIQCAIHFLLKITSTGVVFCGIKWLNTESVANTFILVGGRLATASKKVQRSIVWLTIELILRTLHTGVEDSSQYFLLLQLYLLSLFSYLSFCPPSPKCKVYFLDTHSLSLSTIPSQNLFPRNPFSY